VGGKSENNAKVEQCVTRVCLLIAKLAPTVSINSALQIA
jgi:hypothetical protein